MSLWTSKELVAATGGKLLGTVSKRLEGVAIDSRSIVEGDVFIAIKGDMQDGHIYVTSALENGAGIAVVSKPDEDMAKAGALLIVDDTLKAMEQIGLASRARSKAKIIAVTGSVGKTTTKDALAVGLSACGKTHASVASFNNHWGVPLTLARMAADTEYAVFEIGMNHKGEIAELVRMVRPDVAIITAIAESHLGYFASVEEISDAKAEIFDGIEPGGAAIINQDCTFFERLQEQARQAGVVQVVGFGKIPGADVLLQKSVFHNSCSCVSARVLGEDVTFKLGSPGEHVVMNTLAVLAGVKLVGADLTRAVLALADLTPPKGRGVRLQLSTKGGNFLVIDESYNANPTSMRAALALLARAEPQGSGRRIAVIGDMLELGENSEKLHVGLAEDIEQAGIDRVYACGPHMKTLWDALPPFRQALWQENSCQLLATLLDDIRAGDVIMIKGSLGSKMGPLVTAITDRFSSAEKAA
jgi:UDP-N-acetylmuramoyl-tripeptide--D-alanyl-D-alanine ligase